MSCTELRSKKYGLTLLLILNLLLTGCVAARPAGIPHTTEITLTASEYLNKARGYWLATLVGNYSGLPHEGQYIAKPSPDETIEWALLPEYTTDDDTLVEWVNIRILEEHGVWPSYAQVRDKWIAHLNHDIWWANRAARDLMDRGLLPPATGQTEHNPHSGWNIDAQIESEVFGVVAPAMPLQARERAAYFARVTNHGLPVDTASFYAVLYALAFIDDDVNTMVSMARSYYPDDAEVAGIIDNVVAWHQRYPDDWRETRRHIRDWYDVDPNWNAARVNFASTLMALLYGEGDFEHTVTIAVLAGWDSDCNATTAAGLIGTIAGYDGLPAYIRKGAGHVYVNEDVTGDLPKRETLTQTAARLQGLAEQTILARGGRIEEKPADRIYYIATGK